MVCRCSSLFSCVLSIVVSLLFFFFMQKTAYEMRISDWSSDVCSSDLIAGEARVLQLEAEVVHGSSVDLGRDAAQAPGRGSVGRRGGPGEDNRPGVGARGSRAGTPLQPPGEPAAPLRVDLENRRCAKGDGQFGLRAKEAPDEHERRPARGDNRDGEVQRPRPRPEKRR